MPGSIKIVWIAGTTIRIHITYLLFRLWAWIEAGWYGLPFLVLSFVCVLGHQFGHIQVARAFKIMATDVTLGCHVAPERASAADHVKPCLTSMGGPVTGNTGIGR